MTLRPLALALLVSATACITRNDTDPPLPPAPGTGQLAIDMEGVWEIEHVELVERLGPAPAPSGTAPSHILTADALTPRPGIEVRIGAGMFVDDDGGPLLLREFPGPIRSYLNNADGRFAALEIDTWIAHDDCPVRVRFEMLLGSTPEGAMEGLVRLRRNSTCEELMVNTGDGLFFVRARRLPSALPASLGR